MGIKEFGGLLGGLALFLYGMNMMSNGMEAAAGSKLKQILERLTSNRFLGVLVGAVITAIIQSSSATTVMVVGFVNSGMMTLQQAVWIIMGANIGTTITGQLIALDIGVIAPFIAFIGVVMVSFMKKEKVRHIGSIFAGLGVLFIGMDMMSSAMMPLRESDQFVAIMTQFSNPLLGILAGMVFTAIIQSSSASVGILQALAKSGAISFSSSVFVLFGQNIGTCITAVLASIGANKNAKRTTIIHLSFNIIGTIVFVLLCLSTPLISWVAGITPNSPKSQIANMHTLFNIVTTLLLLPCGTLLVKLAQKILPGEETEDGENKLLYLKNIRNLRDEKIGVAAMEIEQTGKEIRRMMDMAVENVREGFQAFRTQDSSYLAEVEKREDYVDYLNQKISEYISRFMVHEASEKESGIYSSYFKITGNIERISDHAVNICGYSQILEREGKQFSSAALQEIKEMEEICQKLLTMLIQNRQIRMSEYGTAAAMEQEIDDMTKQFRDNLLERIKQKKCPEEIGILYSEMLTDFERIGDHALNIAEEMVKISEREGNVI